MPITTTIPGATTWARACAADGGRFEFFAKAFYQKLEGDLSHEFLSHHTNAHGRVDDYGWVFSPGMIFHLTDHLGFKLAGEFEEHQSSLILGARYHF